MLFLTGTSWPCFLGYYPHLRAADSLGFGFRPGRAMWRLSSEMFAEFLQSSLPWSPFGSWKLVMSVTALRIIVFFLCREAYNNKWIVELQSAIIWISYHCRSVLNLQLREKCCVQHWWQVRYCPGFIWLHCLCLHSEFGLGGETFSRMESVTCCFLTGLKVLARISKERGVSVPFQQELAPTSPGVFLLWQLVSADSSCGADPSVQDMRFVKDLDKGAQKVLVGRKVMCPSIWVFVRPWQNYSWVPWLTVGHIVWYQTNLLASLDRSSPCTKGIIAKPYKVRHWEPK